MARSDRMEPRDVGCDNWYSAYWRERHRCEDLQVAGQAWQTRAIAAERELDKRDDMTDLAFEYPGGMHELVIVATVCLWGAVLDMTCLVRAIEPERFAFLPFRALWSIFRECGFDPLLWVRRVWMCDDQRMDELLNKLLECDTQTFDELLVTVRDFLEIRRITDRLMELT